MKMTKSELIELIHIKDEEAEVLQEKVECLQGEHDFLQEEADEMMLTNQEGRDAFAEMMEDMEKMRLHIAYQDGILDGLGYEKKNICPDCDVIHKPGKDDLDDPTEVQIKAKSRADADKIKNKMDNGECVKESIVKGKCDCPECSSMSAAKEKKIKSLELSSREIKKWARANAVKLDKGDGSDN